MRSLTRTLILFLSLTGVAYASDFLLFPINTSHGLSDNQIRYILQLPDGRMIFTTSGNLNLYDGSSFKYIHRKADNMYALNAYDGFYRMYLTDSLLWIKDTHKLMCVNLHQEKYLPNVGAYFKKSGIEEVVEDFFVDADHQWWLLTPVGLVQQGSSKVLDISENNGRLQDLATSGGLLYLFYNTGAIVCYDLKTQGKRFSKTAYPLAEQAKFKNTSLVVKGHNGFYQLRNGGKGGFFFFDTRKLVWEQWLETDYTLNTLIIDKDETAYISCANGLWKIGTRDGKKEYFPHLKTADGSFVDTEVSTVFCDKQNGLWLGTLNQGLLYYHPLRYMFSNIGKQYFTDNLAKDNTVRAFAEDSLGNVYIGCPTKIYQLHVSQDGTKNLIPTPPSVLPKGLWTSLTQQKKHYFKGKFYNALHTDSRGWTWMATQDGLKLFKPEQNQELIFYTENGLANNFVHAILEDRNKKLWVTTSYGLSKIEVDPVSEKIQFTNFNPLDGTLEGEYTDGAAFEAKDGTLYFGGIHGFNILAPDKLPSAPLPFKPVFTNLFLQGEKIAIGNEYGGRVVLPQAAPYTNEITLAYNQNFLRLEFSALNYLNPAQTRYRYQLKGINDAWQETFAGHENFGANGILSVSYTNLPPGQYTFSVMATNGNNPWSGAAAELSISILPPWWKTNVAYLLYSLALFIMGFLSIYLYTHFTRKKLEHEHREKMLLFRIKTLIEQYSLLEAEKEPPLPKNNTEENNQLHSADTAFLSKAIAMVEKNLNEPHYSVEQLSNDLCMDRTGLYRKLIAVLDQSPSLFIRSIRLEKAAQLILEGKLSIAEISEKVGFSSSSYLSKCFQEMYGCRPSEYAEKIKKST